MLPLLLGVLCAACTLDFTFPKAPPDIGVDGGQEDAALSDGPTPDGFQPDGFQPDGFQPDGSQPDGSQADGAQADSAQTDAAKPDGPLPDVGADGSDGGSAFVYVSDLPFAAPEINGWGPVERDISNGETPAGDGHPLTINGTSYAKGLGVHAHSEVTFSLAGMYRRFLAQVGVDDEVNTHGSVTFEVWSDGNKVYDSGLLDVSSPAHAIDIDVSGVSTLKLIVTDGGNGISSDHGDWADARLER